MSKVNPLHIEQRISIVIAMLNEQSTDFSDALPEKKKLEFDRYVWDLIEILDGDVEGDVRKRLGILHPG